MVMPMVQIATFPMAASVKTRKNQPGAGAHQANSALPATASSPISITRRWHQWSPIQPITTLAMICTPSSVPVIQPMPSGLTPCWSTA